MGCMQSCLSGGTGQRPATSSSHHAPRPSHSHSHHHHHSYSEKPTAIEGRRPPTAPVPGTHRSWKAVEHDGGQPQASEVTIVESEMDLGIKGKEEDVDDEERARRMREARRKAEAEEQERRNDFQFL